MVTGAGMGALGLRESVRTAYLSLDDSLSSALGSASLDLRSLLTYPHLYSPILTYAVGLSGATATVGLYNRRRMLTHPDVC
jgi:hypothetical protein